MSSARLRLTPDVDRPADHQHAGIDDGEAKGAIEWRIRRLGMPAKGAAVALGRL